MKGINRTYEKKIVMVDTFRKNKYLILKACKVDYFPPSPVAGEGGFMKIR